VLFGSFAMMDGYARFDRGEHRVFLGVDESFADGPYLDILSSHELTHVARESQPLVWTSLGLDPKMSHDDFAVSQPTIEHLFSEGFSCVMSELLNPGHGPWRYAYQSPETLDEIKKLASVIDEKIHRQLADEERSYRELYDVSGYRQQVPWYSHYVWAWKWVSHLLHDHASGDPKRLLGVPSQEFYGSALNFHLAKSL
jgi:hypothetical protein